MKLTIKPSFTSIQWDWKQSYTLESLLSNSRCSDKSDCGGGGGRSKANQRLCGCTKSYDQSLINQLLIGLKLENTCLWGFANNKCANQPVLPCSLISALLFAYLKVPYLVLTHILAHFCKICCCTFKVFSLKLM